MPSHRRILLVEDVYKIANDLHRTLERDGAVVTGSAATVEEALHLLDVAPVLEGTLLDIELHDHEPAKADQLTASPASKDQDWPVWPRQILEPRKWHVHRHPLIRHVLPSG
jgi:CheY-like chemotaxis protein